MDDDVGGVRYNDGGGMGGMEETMVNGSVIAAQPNMWRGGLMMVSGMMMVRGMMVSGMMMAGGGCTDAGGGATEDVSRWARESSGHG